MNTPKPYNEKRNGNIIYRNFSQDIDESELIWHMDKEDRYVKVLNESDWGFQMDNELPIRLKKGTELFIPKETYHRVLKGRSDLNILIKENIELQDEEVTAYHGGPHSFDKFSTQYMKTGEGNQSFGWGLYFTDLEDVAKHYAETIGDDSTKIWEKIKEIFYTGLGLNDIDNFKYSMIEDIQSGKINIKQAVNKLKWVNIPLRDVSDEKIAELFNKALNLERQKKYIYKVTLHKGKTPEQYNWLEWYEPLSNRQKDLILNNLPNNPAKRYKIENLKNRINLKGSEIYKMLSDIFNSDKEASLFLLSIGIDGIKYPTGTLSSALGIKTDNTKGFNYVVFDENAVSIEKQTQLQENYNATDVDVLFKQNPDLEKSVYAILGYNKEIDDKNYEVRKAKYAAQNKIMSDKQVSFANGRGLDRTVRELRKINTPESNIVADLIEVERVNIRAKQFNTKTDEGKLKSKEQYDIKNRLLDNVFKQYRKNGWDVKYEKSNIPGVAHTLFFTIPDTDIQLSYHGNYENISKYFNSLPEGRWDGIPGATFHKLEEAALDIINENNMDKTDWRKGIDLGQEFIQLPYTYTEQQKQEAREIYSEYLQNNPEGDLEGFKEYIDSKNLQLETMEISKKDLIQNWLNNPKKLKEDGEMFEITKGELEEEKKKADRCLRIARRKMPQTSAYRSGLIVQCRRGKIWKKGK